MGSANVILTSGAKCYASTFLLIVDSMSLVGDIGFVWSSLWFQKFGDKYNVKSEYISAGENKIKFNPFQ